MTVCMLLTSAAGQSNLPTDTLIARLASAKELLPGDPLRADSLSRLILDQALSAGIDSITAKAYYTLGVCNYYAGRNLLSAEYYGKALETKYAREHLAFESAIWNNLGILHEIDNQIPEAFDAYLRSLQGAEKLGDSLSIFQSYINLGFLSIFMNNLKNAETYLLKALHYFELKADDYNTALCLHDLAVLARNQRNIGQSLAYYEAALKKYEKAGVPQKAFEMQIDRMNMLIEEKMISQIERLMPALMKQTTQISNPYVQSMVMTVRGNYNLLLGNTAEAEADFLQAEQGFKESKSDSHLYYLYERMAELYAEMNNPAKLKQALEKYFSFIKKTYSDKSSSRVAELHVMHELEKKEQRAKMLEVQLGQQRKINYLWLGLGAIGLMAALVTLPLFFNVRRQKKALFGRNRELMQLVEKERQQVSDAAGQSLSFSLTEESGNIFFLSLFDKVKSHIVFKRRYLDPSLKISDIAAELGTNEKYISQAMSVGGQTKFTRFINFYRINEAKRLLESLEKGDFRVKDISFKSGFSNQPQFQRKFKEMTGMTPYEYMQMREKEDSPDNAAAE